MNIHSGLINKPDLQIIIFCLNRPILCEHLLESINNYLKGNYKISIIYGSSNKEFEKGFQILQSKYRLYNIKFIKKNLGFYKTPWHLLFYPRNLFYYLIYPQFRNTRNIFNFKELLEKELSESSARNVCFLTDDSFFYREFEWNSKIGDIIEDNPSQNSYSFRHGLNIRGNDVSKKFDNMHLQWNYDLNYQNGHWAYRFSIDGHVYNRIFLLNFVKNKLYINPSTFEGIIERYAEVNSKLKFGFSSLNSILAGMELNRVQDISFNNSLDIDNDYLNECYLKNFKLKIHFDDKSKEFRPTLYKVILIDLNSQKEIILYSAN
ncbi:hypothetical protein ICV32_01765 [Polynucleobacter sp. MWH-UH24A]|uniref:hypothetical protein n=1 Tax=Polynucleobacter sp. MWH-UH24A TaxID=2689110 RepID=UPI001BFEDEDC|nr:hypothetical protein [Polynucleobacter sp. MWH-UH24A]QWD76425.1 hypothetical protein ICV32_01765 [Polynucleobacter sp. MWH-UH24A]